MRLLPPFDLAMSETQEEYLKRRKAEEEDIIAKRLQQAANAPKASEPSSDYLEIAGCYDCQSFWQGAGARALAKQHREDAKHTVWMRIGT